MVSEETGGNPVLHYLAVARAARDFERADEIRDKLAEAGWEIRDTPEGARLVRAP